MNDRSLNMKIVFFVLVCTNFIACNSIQKKKSETTKKPNIVFILVDDLGWADTGFMGSKVYETPNIDKLSKEGVVFTNAYAPSANCAPSRACILTGKNTPNHGIYTVGTSERGKSKDRKIVPTPNTDTLADEFITIAEALKKNGYTTVSIGKWHVSDDPKTQGFDINIGGSHDGHPKSYFSPYINKNLSDGKDGEYLTERLTNEAINFMSTNNERPFFLYLPYYTVHTPLQGKEELVDKFEAKINGDNRFNAKYGAMIASLDENVGKLLKSLETLHIEDNTLVVFYSDNGGLASISSQSPLRGGKGSYYEGGIRVPCIMKWPAKIKESKRTSIPMTGLDFFPTLMDVVNDKEDYDLEGISLLPFLTENKNNEERALFWHFPIYLESVNPDKEESRDPLFRTRPGSVVRKGKWKLHEYFEGEEFELYNLETDLGEKVDLSKKHPEKVKELYEELNSWRIKTKAPVPKLINPDYLKPY